MKKIKLGLAALTLFAAFTFSACNNQDAPVVEEEVEVVEEGVSGEFVIDAEASKISWLGKKVTGEHFGDIKISEGKFALASNVLVDGKVEVNMTTITVNDIEDEEMNAKLVGHLNSEDFFNTANFPGATLVITEADESHAAGDLTIKGITNPVKFEYSVEEGESTVTLTGLVVVDRTLYEIKYGSGKFFEDLGDKTIYDEFELKFEVVANK